MFASVSMATQIESFNSLVDVSKDLHQDLYYMATNSGNPAFGVALRACWFSESAEAMPTHPNWLCKSTPKKTQFFLQSSVLLPHPLACLLFSAFAPGGH